MLPTYLTHLYGTGLERLSATRAALLASLEVPVALLTAVLYGERFSGWGVLGVVLVLAVPFWPCSATGRRGARAAHSATRATNPYGPPL